jgi:hypothetical protein
MINQALDGLKIAQSTNARWALVDSICEFALDFLSYFEVQWMPLLNRFARFGLGDDTYRDFWTNNHAEGMNSRVDRYFGASDSVHNVVDLVSKVITLMQSGENMYNPQVATRQSVAVVLFNGKSIGQ